MPPKTSGKAAAKSGKAKAISKGDKKKKESNLTLAERLARQEVADGIAKGEFHLSKTDKSSRLVLDLNLLQRGTACSGGGAK